MKKKIFSTILFIVFVLSMSTVCFAAETSFTKKDVDSNSFTFICRATKESTSSTASVKITDIYTASGGASTYVQVIARACSDGSVRLVTRGIWADLPIPSAYQGKGSSVPLYCTGRTPFLDCQVSGYWNVH